MHHAMQNESTGSANNLLRKERSAKGVRTLFGVSAALVLASTLFGGCDEPSSPRGAVQRVAQALVHKDRAALRESLNGAALRRYGSDEGAQALREVVGARSLALGTASLRYREEPVAGFDRLRIYTLPVIEKEGGATALVATVTCSVHWISRGGYVYRTPISTGQGAGQGSGPSAVYTPVESCRVTDVEVGQGQGQGEGQGEGTIASQTAPRPEQGAAAQSECEPSAG